MLRIVHYVNQFFGQKGGEEFTGMEPVLQSGPVPVGHQLQLLLGDQAEVICTIIAGDNYMAENLERGAEQVLSLLDHVDFDLFVAGPAFFAGRYGLTCGALCAAVIEKLGKKAVSAMYEENPGVDGYRSKVLIAPCGKSAAKMRAALENLAALIKSVASGREIPDCEYFKQGRRVNIRVKEIGAVRAFQMLNRNSTARRFKRKSPILRLIESYRRLRSKISPKQKSHS